MLIYNNARPLFLNIGNCRMSWGLHSIWQQMPIRHFIYCFICYSIFTCRIRIKIIMRLGSLLGKASVQRGKRHLYKASGRKWAGWICFHNYGCVCEIFTTRQKKVAFLIDRESFDKKTVTSFMKEVFEAEEFGHSDTDRMVVLRGTKLTDYIREFHHQMKLTYPKASRCIVLYPALWVMTLCGFLYRNRKVRGHPVGRL